MAAPFQVLIVGSNVGGYVTALCAAQLGFKTAIVGRWLSLGHLPELACTRKAL